jgi:hypothetical protein
VISEQERARFEADGFLIKRRLFSAQEVAAVRAVAQADPRRIAGQDRGGDRAEGRVPELWAIGSPQQPPAKPLSDAKAAMQLNLLWGKSATGEVRLAALHMRPDSLPVVLGGKVLVEIGTANLAVPGIRRTNGLFV